MKLGEKLKILRKQAQLSQEQLAHRLSVSRQAITKWETDAGLPDIDNLKAISSLFNISLDELLSENELQKEKHYLYQSITEYDIEEPKYYDMNLKGAQHVEIVGYEGEKIIICLASSTYSALQKDYKIKLDEIKNRIDIDLKYLNNVTEAESKKMLNIFIYLPSHYMRHIECNVHCGTIKVESLHCEDIELDIRTPSVSLKDVSGHIEINGHLDMHIECDQLRGRLDINSINATSTLSLEKNTLFKTVSKGIGTSIQYEGITPQEEADTVIELNGIKSELIIQKKQQK